MFSLYFNFYHPHLWPSLEGTVHYLGLLLAPAEGFILCPRLFMPFGQKIAFPAVCAYFRPFFVCSSNISNFSLVTLVNLKIIQKNSKNPQKIQKLKKDNKKINK